MQLFGYIDHIIYRSEESGYTVFVLIPDGETGDPETDEEGSTACTGTFSSITAGQFLNLTGKFTEHISYGHQFQIESYQIVAPKDAASVLRYLSSGAIRGIGPKLARRIVDAFGDDTFRVMEEEPERLAEVRGISERKAMEIASIMARDRDAREAAVYLGKFGISERLALRIYDTYGTQLYSVIAENPYRMAEEIEGVGFRMADAIAAKAGLAPDSDERIRSGIRYVLHLAEGNGNIYLPAEILMQQSVRLLSVSENAYRENIEALLLERSLIAKEDRVYEPAFYYMEKETASRLLGLAVRRPEDPEALFAEISAIERAENLSLDERQREAVAEASENGIFILTGGPGTGKTTTLRVLIRLFEQRGEDIFLAAPTGRAAKRMSQATGRPARTIHRMLEVTGASSADGTENGRIHFERNADNPLECDVVVVDEVSMVDLPLMLALLRAMPEEASLILVGDRNQLPSVGPGNVLEDLLASGAFPTLELNRIFRQSEGSDIITNAHAMLTGRPIRLDNHSRDFFFLEREDADHILAAMISMIRDHLPDYLHIRRDEIQVLCPMRKGEVGTERLNGILQDVLNPAGGGKGEHRFGDTLFREGDKVMQIKNNYQMEWTIRGKYGIAVESGTGVFNGDIGRIEEIDDFSSGMRVLFDDEKEVFYSFSQLGELTRAYAVTIHKSQGSEYPAVIIPLLPGAEPLMNRNLIYTAVTRAKRCVCLIGRADVFDRMVQNTNRRKRWSHLAQELQQDHMDNEKRLL